MSQCLLKDRLSDIIDSRIQKKNFKLITLLAQLALLEGEIIATPNASALLNQAAGFYRFLSFDGSELILGPFSGVSSPYYARGNLEKETIIVDDVTQHANYNSVIAGLRAKLWCPW